MRRLTDDELRAMLIDNDKRPPSIFDVRSVVLELLAIRSEAPPAQDAYDAVYSALANAQEREAAVMPVVEAAQAWRRERVPLDDVGKRLAEAVDYLAHEIAAHDGGE